MNLRPLKKFLALVGDPGHERQAPLDAVDMLVRAAFVKRVHFWCGLGSIRFHGTPRGRRDLSTVYTGRRAWSICRRWLAMADDASPIRRRNCPIGHSE